jgi:hypothetical protein
VIEQPPVAQQFTLGSHTPEVLKAQPVRGQNLPLNVSETLRVNLHWLLLHVCDCGQSVLLAQLDGGTSNCHPPVELPPCATQIVSVHLLMNVNVRAGVGVGVNATKEHKARLPKTLNKAFSNTLTLLFPRDWSN